MMARTCLQQARRLGDRYAGVALAGGVAALVAYNLRQWRRDRALAVALRTAREDSSPPVADTPRVTVLVAAWNEADLIERHVESLLALRYPNLEYVLCAGGTDDTYRLASRYERPGVVVLEQRSGEGKQAALRRGLQHASGDVIFLTDADCLLDDDSFERTVAPIVAGEAEATSGGSRPLTAQLASSVLATYRWSADAYANAHAPRDGEGLFGRNAAVSRAALAAAGDLRADVATGTDYHLAKSLLASGLRIRQVAESQVATRYPESVPAYLRQQRRWLRNLMVHGWRFRAYHEVAVTLRSSLIGLGMLALPAALPLAGRGLLVLWLLALLNSAAGKVRYLAFAASVERNANRRVIAAGWASALPLSLVEFVVWAAPLIDLLVPSWRRKW
jgi:cellulose synthase/poly-beta-1,6-N-acetylglucosamine synthase-like glycosyltransferase